MAIIQSMVSSFKQQCLQGVHDFSANGDVFKLALYTAAADLGPNTVAYTSANEVVGAGYTAGGVNLVSLGTFLQGSTAFVDFQDAEFPLSDIVARGALVYNSTATAFDPEGNPISNPAVAVLNFGSDRASSGGNFTVIFPPPTPTSAVIRIA